MAERSCSICGDPVPGVHLARPRHAAALLRHCRLQKLGDPFTFELFTVQGDVPLPSSVPVEYSGAGEPHAACKAEHLILHEWDFAMNAAHNADYAWGQLQDIWPQQLGDVHSLPA